MWRRFGPMVIALLFAACGGGDEGPSSGDTPDELRGVITEVSSSGLTEVEAFTLRSEGTSYEIKIAEDTNLGFPPAHLNEHRASGEPVIVRLRSSGGDLYATSVEDG